MARRMVLPRTMGAVLSTHHGRYRQMAFVACPRQVGKTTTSREFATSKSYFSWDDPDHRRLILKGPAAISDVAGTAQLHDRKPVIVFDELHKYALEGVPQARDVNVSVDTIRRWIAALGALYFGFLVRPWYRNVGKSLRKEPKWYCLDWSSLDDRGQRLETLVACHLLKAVHTWQDLGLGTYELRYLRDKQKREADFVVIRNQKPWFIVEVKLSDTSLSPSLEHFQRQISPEHAFQAVLEIDPVKQSCFTRHDPCVVPLRTLLAQLP
jgi:predicted AAA+ superfamily ATPase